MEAQQSNQMSETNKPEITLFTNINNSIMFIFTYSNGSALVVDKDTAVTILGNKDAVECMIDMYHHRAADIDYSEYSDHSDDSFELYDGPEESDDSEESDE
jgi:hypothetical protein